MENASYCNGLDNVLSSLSQRIVTPFASGSDALRLGERLYLPYHGKEFVFGDNPHAQLLRLLQF